MALNRLIVFVFAAVALAGCCASGTGCPAPLPPELATTDGLVSSRDDGFQPGVPSIAVGESKGRMARSKANRSFAEQDAMDQEAAAELTSHLKICNGCGASGRDGMSSDRMGGDKMSGSKMSGDNMAGDGMGSRSTGRAAAMSRPKNRENNREMSTTGE
jgi:hypothetical protein